MPPRSKRAAAATAAPRSPGRALEPRPQPAPAGGAAAAWALAALVAGLAAAIYAPATRFDFVNYDDYHYVVENPHVASGLSARNVAWALTAFSAANWHPLTWISHMADCSLFGLDASGHHLTSLILHALDAALLVLALRALTGALWPGVLAAALFAAHPLNVESVAWVAERKNVLSTLFWILALWAYAGYARRPSRGRYALVALLVALGLLSKPMAVTLPCVLLLLDWWPLGRWDPRSAAGRAPAAALVREKLPLLALSAAASLLTLAAQKQAGAVSTLAQVPFAARLANAVIAYAAYLGKMLWPARLSVFYPHAGSRVSLAQLALAAAVLAAVCAAVWRLRRPALAVGWLWYLGTLVPVIGIVQVGSQAMADRYAYVPLLGIFLALAWTLREAATTPAAARGLALAAAAVVAALAWSARVQVGHWADSITLFSHARAVTRDNYVAHTNLGIAYNKQKRWHEAIARFREALRIQPRSAEALGHMGLSLARLGRIDEAVEALTRAIAIYPPSVHGHNNLGVALRKRDPERSLQHLRRAVELDPDFAEARVNLAATLFHLGRSAEARAQLDGALALDPRSPATQFRVGSALLERGMLDDAQRRFETALGLDPGHAGARNSLGVVRLRRGDPAAALAEFRRALERAPDDADVHSNIGTALVRLGRLPEARAALARAVELNPQQADAHATLGAVLAREGRLDDAAAHFRQAVEADPDNAVAHNNLGAALLQQGRIDDARAHLARAVELNPGSADAQANLGALLLQQGDARAALPHLEAALRLAPDHRNARAHLTQAREREGRSRY